MLSSLATSWKEAQLIVPLGQPQDGERQQAWRLMRETPARGKWPRTLLPEGVALPSGQPAVVNAEGAPLVALHPIALFRRPSPETAEELFVLDGSKKQGARYIAFPSVSEHVESEVWGQLTPILLGGKDEANEQTGPGAWTAPRSFGTRPPALCS